MSLLSYFEYYHRAIQQHPTGLKLVLGGTGLGKTSGIEAVVQAPEYQQHKFIYIANRKQLVEGIAQSLKPPCYIVLHRDLEVVCITLRDFHHIFYELFEDSLFTDNVQRWNDKNPIKRVDLPTVKRACKALEELVAENVTIPKVLEEQMDGYAHAILGAFKAALLGANNKRGNSPAYLRLIEHPVIQALFPYIAFKRRPEIRLMAVTLQKAFYGFFDGKKTLNLTRLEEDDGGYVIFLDEFDFLENDLVGLICRAPQISNPFRVVELFYRAMTSHKLPLETYPLSDNIRNRIKEIKAIVDQLQNNDHLKFPEINQFTSTIPQQMTAVQKHGRQVKASPAIFRTQHTISTGDLYLRQTNRSFEIFSESDVTQESLYHASRLFDAVSQACEQILFLFKELQRGDDEIIYREMLRHCFQDTIFPEELALISQFSRPQHQGQDSTQLSALLETGYSLYDIHDLQQRTDQEEVEVQHYGMHLTPEMILCSLAQHNLVFGLSATADIQRYVHHFHLDWLRQQVNFIPISETDIEIIHNRNQHKADKRKTQLEIAILDGLDTSDGYQHQLDQFFSAVAKDEDFGNETREGHLKKRVQIFFAVLLWLRTHSKERDTYLLFFNTFRQIKLVFDRYAVPDENLFEIVKRTGNRWFEAYEIVLQERRLIVIFYNAQMANMVRQSQEAQQIFDGLFWENIPVVVVTQYLSAGNGVNLQYRPSPDKTGKQDFTHIGLLETPYFYFGKPDSELPWDERIAMLKENIWYQAKLYTGNVITEQRFRQVLSTLNDPWEWNRRYQTDSRTRVDALFNHMATFMQALGRVERIWDEMPNQTVLFSRDVYSHFQRFCSPEFEQYRQERQSVISKNLQTIFQLIEAEQPQLERAVRRHKDARLGAKNERCQESIKDLLTRLEGLRQGNGDGDARIAWQRLRHAALQHQFRDQLLNEYECVSTSSYYHNNMLYLTPQNEIIPAHIAQPDAYHWRMDALYYVIRDNRVIHDYFEEHDYKLAFSPSDQHFFTPYCYQAILAGAIGEEAITALLRDEGIELEEMPDVLFEVADLKIRDQPWYIDCKNYNEQTLDRFTVSPDDPVWHPKLNEEHFADSARLKVGKLRAYHGTPVKLIYLNLVTSQPRPHGYYDCDFRQVSFAESSIVVIQGALQRRIPNAYHQAFIYLLHDLSSVL